ncbi:hypothetical protein D3C81_1556110 [compost metagenome]
MWQPQPIHARYRLALHQALPAYQRKNTLVHRSGQELGLVVGFGHHHRNAQHHVRLVERGRRLEMVAVDTDRLMHVARREVRGEGVGHAAHAGQLCAEQAGAEQPHRHLGVVARYGDHFLIICARAKVARQFFDIVREIIGAARTLPAQGACGHLVGARRTAQAQIDTPWIKAG